MIIGIPKEIMPGELRVAATPETVQKMVRDGAKLLVQTDAGKDHIIMIRIIKRLVLKLLRILKKYLIVLM